MVDKVGTRMKAGKKPLKDTEYDRLMAQLVEARDTLRRTRAAYRRTGPLPHMDMQARLRCERLGTLRQLVECVERLQERIFWCKSKPIPKNMGGKPTHGPPKHIGEPIFIPCP